ncbi:expressed unknown protein [Seminavis robusta]|uniref:Uncharacterized protein n=1 Tax=Seminavis robusta TaxID=568900 RepID=A0A9N8HN43_9STRA|nr:expressed unknown protein [Seminavis robusta]|eukprot:Sro959_g224720.1 n/a (774) ;mRNA; f:4746-7133
MAPPGTSKSKSPRYKSSTTGTRRRRPRTSSDSVLSSDDDVVEILDFPYGNRSLRENTQRKTRHRNNRQKGVETNSSAASDGVAAIPAARRQRNNNQNHNDDSSSESSVSLPSRRRRRRQHLNRGATKTTGLSLNGSAVSRGLSRSRTMPHPPLNNNFALTAPGTQDEPVELEDEVPVVTTRGKHLTTPQRTAAATKDDPIPLLESSDSEMEAMIQEAIIASMKDRQSFRKSTGTSVSTRTRSTGRQTNNSKRRKTMEPELHLPRSRTSPKPSKTTSNLDKKPAAKLPSKPDIGKPTAQKKEGNDSSTKPAILNTVNRTNPKTDGTKQANPPGGNNPPVHNASNGRARAAKPGETNDVSSHRAAMPIRDKVDSESAVAVDQLEKRVTRSHRTSGLKEDNTSSSQKFTNGASNKKSDIKIEERTVDDHSIGDKTNTSSVMKLEAKTTIKQDPEGCMSPKKRKHKKFPMKSKDLGGCVQVERGIGSFPARIVLDEHANELSLNAGFVFVQWSDSQEREEVSRRSIRYDLAVDSDASASTTGTRRSTRRRTQPKTLQGFAKLEEVCEVNAQKSGSSPSVGRPVGARLKSENDEANKKQAQSKRNPQQPRSSAQPVAKPMARKRDESGNRIDSASCNGNQNPAENHSSKARRAKKPHVNDPDAVRPRPRPKPKVSRYMKAPTKPKYVRPARPEIGSMVWLVQDAMFRNPCVRAEELYERRRAQVVGESVFAFTSPHERSLQLQCLDTGDFWYARESDVITPVLWDDQDQLEQSSDNQS